MLYKRSNSLLTYYTRQKEVLNLLRTINGGRLTIAGAASVSPVLRAGVVLLYSHIEGYVENCVEEAMDFINRSGINSDRLPRSFLIAHCLPTIKCIANTTNTEEQERLLTDVLVKNYPLWSGATLPPAKLELDCLTRNFANPSFEHIDKLFRQLGIPKVFGLFFYLGFPVRKVDLIRPTLEVLASLRHDIAHGNLATVCSYQDLVGYVKTMNWFCRCFDAMLGLHLVQLTGSFPWKN